MPLAIAGAALSVVGTGLAMAGNAKAQSSMAKTRAQEAVRQAGLAHQNENLYDKSVKKSDLPAMQQQTDAGTAQRQSAWNDLQTSTQPIASALPANGGAAATRAGAAGNAWNKLTSRAQAKEGGYQDWQNQQDIKNADTAQKMSVNNNFSEADARLFPAELQVAGQAGAQLSGWGNIVSAVGSLVTTIGMSGKPKTGVSAKQSQAPQNEFNGTGAPGMAGDPQVLPATDADWGKIYSGTA